MTKLAQHWTSVEAQLGFRHFRVVAQGGSGPERWVELAALLDSTQRLRASGQLVMEPGHRLRWREPGRDELDTDES